MRIENLEMLEARRKDFAAGLTDEELAEKWGITVGGVRLYRCHKRMLRPPSNGFNCLPREEAESREQDWLNGLDDVEMAKKWFVTVLAVQAYRLKRGWKRGGRGGYRRRKMEVIGDGFKQNGK